MLGSASSDLQLPAPGLLSIIAPAVFLTALNTTRNHPYFLACLSLSLDRELPEARNSPLSFRRESPAPKTHRQTALRKRRASRLSVQPHTAEFSPFKPGGTPLSAETAFPAPAYLSVSTQAVSTPQLRRAALPWTGVPSVFEILTLILWDKHPKLGLLDHMLALVLNFRRNLRSVFHSGHPSFSPAACKGSSFSTHVLAKMGCLVSSESKSHVQCS